MDPSSETGFNMSADYLRIKEKYNFGKHGARAPGREQPSEMSEGTSRQYSRITPSEPSLALTHAKTDATGEPEEKEAADSTTVMTGMPVVLRGPNGSCLSVLVQSADGETLSIHGNLDTADPELAHPGVQTTPKTEAKRRAIQTAKFKAAAKGRGFGEEYESITFANRHHKSVNPDEAEQPVKYGDLLQIRSRYAREKCLAPSSSSRDVVFERNVGGKAEDWELLPAATGLSDRVGFDDASKSRISLAYDLTGNSGATLNATVEPRRQRGAFLRAGDRVALKSSLTGELLVAQTTFDLESATNYFVTTTAEASVTQESSTWQVIIAGTPHCPAWSLQRPYLTGQFILRQQRHMPHRVVESLFGSAAQRDRTVTPLNTLPTDLQEKLLLDDLLSVFMGLEGQYLRIAGDERGRAPRQLERVTFTLDPHSMDRSLAHLADKFLPLGSDYITVRAFIRRRMRHELGMVSHALASAMRVLVKEYLVLIAQLEHQHRLEQLTLHKLWFFVQPAMHTMQTLRQLSTELENLSGGELLNKLHVAADIGGDLKRTELTHFLLTRASKPYLEMLQQWLFEGQLQDPYEEFMVVEKQDLDKETVASDPTTTYWEARYTLQHQHVARFLETHKEKVLTTGKYLNVVRECGRDVCAPHSDQAMNFALTEAAYTDMIEQAFTFASSTVMELLLRESKLLQRLRSIKHYFFLNQGDLYVNFMDLAEEELKQDKEFVSKPRVEALLALAVQSSVCNSDPFKEDLTCDFAECSLIQHLSAIHSHRPGTDEDENGEGGDAVNPFDMEIPMPTPSYGPVKGRETFMLDYTVQWPLSLVLSRRAITKYQLIFRHLFSLRHVERCLKATWKSQQMMKELDVREITGGSFCLRHRMLGFVQSIVYYVTTEVIEPRWHEMEIRLGQAKDLDEILKWHSLMQNTVLEECLLSYSMIKFFDRYRVSEELMAQEMAQQREHRLRNEGDLSRTRASAPTPVDSAMLRRERIKVQSEQMTMEFTAQGFVSMIQKYEFNFDRHIKAFMQNLRDFARNKGSAHLANLATRLDYNEFFAQS